MYFVLLAVIKNIYPSFVVIFACGCSFSSSGSIFSIASLSTISFLQICSIRLSNVTFPKLSAATSPLANSISSKYFPICCCFTASSAFLNIPPSFSVKLIVTPANINSTIMVTINAISVIPFFFSVLLVHI